MTNLNFLLTSSREEARRINENNDHWRELQWFFIKFSHLFLKADDIGFENFFQLLGLTVWIYGQTTIPNPSLHISAYVSQGIFGIAKNEGNKLKIVQPLCQGRVH